MRWLIFCQIIERISDPTLPYKLKGCATKPREDVNLEVKKEVTTCNLTVQVSRTISPLDILFLLSWKMHLGAGYSIRKEGSSIVIERYALYTLHCKKPELEDHQYA